MLKKIIKSGNRKLSKSDSKNASSLNGYNPPGNRNPGPGSAFSVVVNHASRAAAGLNLPSQAPAPAPAPISITRAATEPLPPLRDASISDRPTLFIWKIQICCFQFDFSDTMKNVREKEVKRQTLMDLVEFIQFGSCKLTERCQEEMIKMIAVNIFRSLPPGAHENTGQEVSDPEEEEPYFDPSWPHLQLVYELLLRYVISSETDTKVAKRYINHSFVLKLLDMFDSEDPREREYLKTILHRIYGKFMVHRPFIRRGINNIFYEFIYETERHNGIGELLEILGSIINGFALPMKEEHKLFLVRALIPLHKPKALGSYHQQLSYCITQFVEKDYKLADTVIRGLLKYWPVTNCQKEVLFIGELEEVLESTQATEFQRCMVPLFRQIARCLNSSHFQVAERALFLWNNEDILRLIGDNRGVVLPIIFEALEKNIQSHWNHAVHGLTMNVRKMFIQIDGELFEECQRQYAEKQEMAQDLEERRQLAWKSIAEAAAAAETT